MEFGSDRLEKAWKKAASISGKSLPGKKRKNGLFFATTMKIYLNIIKKDPYLTNEYVRVNGCMPQEPGRKVIGSYVHDDVANKRFPITLKSKRELCLGGLQ